MDQPGIKSTSLAKTNFDSEFCGSIPLNFINLVQDHGVLMVLSRQSANIIQISENCNQILSIPYTEILNKSLGDFIPQNQLEELWDKLGKLNNHYQVPISLTFIPFEGKKIPLTTNMHIREDYIILELERVKSIEGNTTFTYLHQQLKFIMAKLKDREGIEELCQTAAFEIKAMSNFDRVMIYKFDEDWNGIVIGEEKENDMEPYLHLRFPASDIPKQARDLYRRNPYRLIPDRSAKSSRLFPVVNPITHSFTDLSDCNLRSAPPVHLEYLKNMNVVASLSTPIIKDSKLWGLISCHHKSPMYLSYEMLSVFELLSGIVSSQLTALESTAILLSKSRLIDINGKLLAKLYTEESWREIIFNNSPNILDLLGLCGSALIYNKEITSVGAIPGKDQIQGIKDWVHRRNLEGIFYSSQLPGIYPEAADFSETGSGIIILPIDIYKGNYIFGFRQEVIVSVEWGGNPYEAIKIEPDGKTYHPRNSFAQWKEVVKHTSIPWLSQEIEAAEVLRTSILQRIIRESN